MMICTRCRGTNTVYMGKDTWHCSDCGHVMIEKKNVIKLTPYQKNEQRVLATGNKWAIENWRATH